MAAFITAEERKQRKALKTHQKKVRSHKASKKRVNALTDALSDAQLEHALVGSERKETKASLLAILQDL